jgi:hypothetical protein
MGQCVDHVDELHTFRHEKQQKYVALTVVERKAMIEQGATSERKESTHQGTWQHTGVPCGVEEEKI